MKKVGCKTVGYRAYYYLCIPISIAVLAFAAWGFNERNELTSIPWSSMRWWMDETLKSGLFLVIAIMGARAYRFGRHLNFSQAGVHVAARWWGERVLAWGGVKSIAATGTRSLTIEHQEMTVFVDKKQFKNMNEIIALMREKLPSERVSIPDTW